MGNETDIGASLAGLGLVGRDEAPRKIPLAGGVSSDIGHVDSARVWLCGKRALAELKVKADWRAPIERNTYEAAWTEEISS